MKYCIPDPETLLLPFQKTLASKIFENCSLYLKLPALFKFDAVADRSGETGQSLIAFLNSIEYVILGFGVERKRVPIPISGLEKMRAYGRSYFAYLFLYSGLEFTLSFLTHTRFNHDRLEKMIDFFHD